MLLRGRGRSTFRIPKGAEFEDFEAIFGGGRFSFDRDSKKRLYHRLKREKNRSETMTSKIVYQNVTISERIIQMTTE